MASKKTKSKVDPTTPTDDISIEDFTDLSPSQRYLRMFAPRVQKKYGDDIKVRNTLDDVTQPVLTVPDLAHQWALQAEGYRGGRSLVIAGDPGASKSSLALFLSNLARQQGGLADYYDLERALNLAHLQYYLNDAEEFIQHVQQPDTINQGFKLMVETNKVYGDIDPERTVPKITVLDALGGGLSDDQLEEDYEVGDSGFAGNAKVTGNACKLINYLYTKTGSVACYINHAKEKIFTGRDALVPRSAEDKIYFPGGKGAIYVCSYLEYLKKGSTLKDNDKARMGFTVTSTLWRNRGRINGRSYSYDVVFGETLRFYPHTMDFLAASATLGLKVKGRRYWCPEIGVTEADKLNDEEMYARIHDDPAVKRRFQEALGILDAETVPDDAEETKGAAAK